MDELHRLIREEAARQGLSVREYARCRLPHSTLAAEIVRRVAEQAERPEPPDDDPARLYARGCCAELYE